MPDTLYESKKIHFIKAVRQATGASLRFAKAAVDLSIATHGTGTGSHEDFIEAVRFLTKIQQDFRIDITGQTWVEQDPLDDLVTAVRLIGSNAHLEKSFLETVIDYWTGDN